MSESTDYNNNTLTITCVNRRSTSHRLGQPRSALVSLSQKTEYIVCEMSLWLITVLMYRTV